MPFNHSIEFHDLYRNLLAGNVDPGRLRQWVAAGVYYGYPQDCIEAFLARVVIVMSGMGTPAEQAIATHGPDVPITHRRLGFIASDRIYDLSLVEITTLINTERYHPEPYSPGKETNTSCPDLQQYCRENRTYETKYLTMLKAIFPIGEVVDTRA